MEPTIEDVSEANLDMLFDWSADAEGQDIGCIFCLYWEEPDCSKWPESFELRQSLKRDWFKMAIAEFGVSAKIALAVSEVVGYVHFARPQYLPNTGEYDCGPSSEDAVFIACLYVRERRAEGMGPALLNAVLDDLKVKDVPAAETYALKGSANNPSGLLNFWLKNGFQVVREDRHFALMRRELEAGRKGGQQDKD